MTDLSNDARVYLILKQGAWYRPDSHGYTTSAIQAGRYTKAEAEDITHPNGPDGPRDGMSYVHEDDLVDDDWNAFSALRQQLAAAETAALERAAQMFDASHRALRHVDLLPHDRPSVFSEAAGAIRAALAEKGGA